MRSMIEAGHAGLLSGADFPDQQASRTRIAILAHFTVGDP
jgi:hypothetical protein